MSILHEVVGPAKVQILAPDDVGTYADLGFTPNGERPTFDREFMYEELGSQETGDEVEQAVYLGQQGLLQFSLMKWDEAVLDDLLEKVIPGNAGTEGQASMGVIGSLLMATTQGASFTFGVKFLTPITGRMIYTFPLCWLQGPGAIRTIEMGNTGTRLSFSLRVIRGSYIDDTPDKEDVLYVKASA